MRRLGYPRYGAQGGDWGSSISRELGILVPEHVAGVHLNMLFTRVPPDAGELTEVEQERVAAAERFRATASGYGAIQSTRPQTIAYGLTDSPVGQLAWIAEKFGEWTDNGLPDEAVDRDQLLANVTVYWLTGTAGSSARLYYEAARSGSWPAGPLDRPHRRGRLSPGDRAGHPAFRRADQQHHALDRVRPRQPLRRHGSTGPADERRTRVLPEVPLTHGPQRRPGRSWHERPWRPLGQVPDLAMP
jgi:hypothetical protein